MNRTALLAPRGAMRRRPTPASSATRCRRRRHADAWSDRSEPCEQRISRGNRRHAFWRADCDGPRGWDRGAPVPQSQGPLWSVPLGCSGAEWGGATVRV